MKRTRGPYALLALLGLAALAVGAAAGWYAVEVNKLPATLESGNQIVGHLEEYHARFGVYPESLEELSAKLGRPLPAPQVGPKAWRYECSLTRQSFTLSFGLNEQWYPNYSYISHLKDWYKDD